MIRDRGTAGSLWAMGDLFAAGIGGDGDIQIYGGTVTAIGGHEAAGIGGGRYSPGRKVTVTGGTVSATGGSGGAGIGGGHLGAGGTVLVTGGTVSARAQLRVGASMTIAEYLVRVWLGEFRRRHSDVPVHLDVLNSEDVCTRVREGTVDIGFVESPALPRNVRHAVVGRDQLVVVVSPDHRWARRRNAITAAELAATPLIVRERGSGTRIALERLLQSHQMAQPTLELASNAAVRISAIAGVAPAVLSHLAVASAIADGELKMVPVTGLQMARLASRVGPRPPPARPRGRVAADSTSQRQKELERRPLSAPRLGAATEPARPSPLV